MLTPLAELPEVLWWAWQMSTKLTLGERYPRTRWNFSSADLLQSVVLAAPEGRKGYCSHEEGSGARPMGVSPAAGGWKGLLDARLP